MAKQTVWTFSDRILDQVRGGDEHAIRRKREMLRHKYLGQEIVRVYSKKRAAVIYLIGDTKRILTEDEFMAFVESGAIVPRVVEARGRDAGHVARQIAGNSQDTADIPITQPDLYVRPQSGDGRAERAVRPATRGFQRTSTPTASPAATAPMPQSVAASVAAVAASPQPVPVAAQPGGTSAIADAAFVLGQTGMMQAIDDSKFFEITERPEFKPIEEPNASGRHGIIGRIAGLFRREG